MQRRLTALCTEYKDIFRQIVKPEPAKVTPIHFDVNKDQWERSANRRSARPVSSTLRDEIKQPVEIMLESNVIRPSQATSWSQLFMVKKPSGKYRFCIDYRNFNKCIKKMGWPLPNIPEMLRRIGDEHRPKVFGTMDLTAGYQQAPIDETSREATAFIT